MIYLASRRRLVPSRLALFGSANSIGGGGGNWWIVGVGREAMGNASSMLTQYDIEEVQEHCNYLCKRRAPHGRSHPSPLPLSIYLYLILREIKLYLYIHISRRFQFNFLFVIIIGV
jgi:hypothetical protein